MRTHHNHPIGDKNHMVYPIDSVMCDCFTNIRYKKIHRAGSDVIRQFAKRHERVAAKIGTSLAS
jgi:hypothetical protein